MPDDNDPTQPSAPGTLDLDGQRYTVVPRDRYQRLYEADMALRYLATDILDIDSDTAGDNDPDVLYDIIRTEVHGHPPDPPQPFLTLATLLQDWQDHVRLAWPDGAILGWQDPDEHQGDPHPTVTLSDALQDALQDAHHALDRLDEDTNP